MMPRKVILYLHKDEAELSLLACILDVNGYRTLKACNLTGASASAASQAINLIIVHEKIVDAEKVCKSLKSKIPSVPILYLAGKRGSEECPLWADATLVIETRTAELLQKIKFLCARKRGPRPKLGAVQSVPNVALKQAGV